jgi:capsular exopolysaccharide synthesis family protein
LAQYDINLREYWRILRKRRVVVILIAIVLGVFSTSFAILRAPTPLYTTVCIIEFERTPPLSDVYGKRFSMSDSDDIETQMTVIKSYAVFQKVAEKMGLIPRRYIKKDGQLEDKVIAIIESLQAKVEVSREGVSSILKITVTDADPLFAQKLANTVALTYREVHAKQQMRTNTDELKYIVSQLEDVREKLRNAEDEFNRFTQENELVSIGLQSENLLARAQDIRKEIRTLKDDKTEFGSILIRLKAFIENPVGSDHDFYSTKANSQYQSTNDTLVGLLLKRDTLLKDFTPRHPDVMAISGQIAENARKMAFLLQTQIRGIEMKEVDLEEELQKVERKTKLLMEKKLEFDRLKRRVELHNEMTVLLERKNQEALIKRAEKPEEVNIVRPALLPTQSINPPNTVATGAMGLIIGLVLGLVIAFIVETFDTSLGAIEDVEQTLGTQVLGIIPDADKQDIQEKLMDKYPKGLGRHSVKHAVNLISHFVPKSMMSESFRALRTNIQFKDPEKKTKTFAITSSSPEEGKTLVATNLAITMAQGGMKTLLVGSDLRKPVMDRVFGVDKLPGLTDCLLGDHPWRDTVKTVTDLIMGKMSWDEIMMTPGLDNLHVITSGTVPPNPTDLIDSKRLEEFIEAAKKEYDVIIFDSSPILSTADAAILGTKVDGVLLVYRVGSVSRGLLKRTTTQLEQVKCNLMGVILNGMKPDVSPDFQDYKYYSYYYSYGEEEKDRGSRQKKKGFPFFRGKKEIPDETQEIWLKKKKRGAPEQPDRKGRIIRLILILVAIVCLAGGVLWQSGLLDSFKQSYLGTPVEKEELKAPTQGKPQKRPVPKRSEGIPTKPRTSKSESPPPTPVRPESAGPQEKPKMEVPASTPETSKPVLPNASSVSLAKPGPDRATSFPEPVPPNAIGPEKKGSVEKPGTEVAVVISKSLPRTRRVSDPEIPETHQVYTKYPYSLRLGAFRTVKRAKKSVASYRKKGLSAYWVKVDLKENGVWFRVYAGHFEDGQEAQRFKDEGRLTRSLVKETPYSVLIGIYAEEEIVEKRILSLKNLDYCPYTIEGQDGKYRLFVGAFVTKEGAEEQREDLESKGIQSQVVER